MPTSCSFCSATALYRWFDHVACRAHRDLLLKMPRAIRDRQRRESIFAWVAGQQAANDRRTKNKRNLRSARAYTI
jgi:hypothetical protein